MTLFKNGTHQDIWIEHNCHRCFQPDEAARRTQGKDTMCPIIKRAINSGRKPKEWDRMPREKLMSKSIKCNAFQATPASTARAKAPEQDTSLFDTEEQPYILVPVDGWPDRPRAGKEVDHA